MRVEANMGRGEGEEEGTEGQTHYVVEQFVAEVSAVKIIKKKQVCQKKEMFMSGNVFGFSKSCVLCNKDGLQVLQKRKDDAE